VLHVTNSRSVGGSDVKLDTFCVSTVVIIVTLRIFIFTVLLLVNSTLILKLDCTSFIVIWGRPFRTYAEGFSKKRMHAYGGGGEVNTNVRTHGGGGGSCRLHLK
jgi:hypothetical protein